MNLHFHDLIPYDFADDSRVWIYQSNRQFTTSETLEIEELLESFSKNWQSHGAPVKGFANVFFGQFVILMADETATGVSGCSTDSSVRLIKNIEEDYNVELFNRELLAFTINERIQLLALSQLKDISENILITPQTLYFNNIVQTKKELLQNWIIPVKDSWFAKRYSLNA